MEHLVAIGECARKLMRESLLSPILPTRSIRQRENQCWPSWASIRTNLPVEPVCPWMSAQEGRGVPFVTRKAIPRQAVATVRSALVVAKMRRPQGFRTLPQGPCATCPVMAQRLEARAPARSARFSPYHSCVCHGCMAVKGKETRKDE